MSETEDLLHLARPLLRRAGLGDVDWTPEILSRRRDRAMHRLVLKLTAPGEAALVLKQVIRPRDPERFEAAMARHAAVVAAMGQGPAIRAHDADAQLVLMEFVAGRTLFDACVDRPPAAHARPLELAGAWTDRFHRAGPVETRQFRPGYTLKHLEALRLAVESGQQPVADRPGFLAALAQTIDTAPGPAQCATMAAEGHGDLNLRNILIEGDHAQGLDFGTPGLLPVGHDLARLFCHYGTLCAVPGQGPDSEGPLPGVDLSAFFRGYGLVAQDDATVAFLCRVRLLRDWAKIPKPAMRRSLPEQIRLRGIKALAGRVFA